jgi:DNA-damage-inducible protein D
MKILPSEFDGQSIRRVFDEDAEVWWFSVIDVVQVLTSSKSAKRYWSDLKRKLAQEAGSGQPYEEIVQLKLTATDGKQRETDCAKAATLLRIVQSIPSPKAEPIKLWLAKVGYERMQEMADPALSLNRARQTWQQHGRSDKWIAQRMTGQETRNKLTDYWADHDIKAGQEFAILTNIIHTEWSGISVKEHKATKGLSSHNLRDHMTEAELIFTALAELSTRQIAETTNATGLPENTTAAKAGGGQAGTQTAGKPNR